MPNLKGRLDEFLLSSQVMIENALADAEIGQALSAFGAAGPNFWPKHGCKLMRTEKGTFSVAAVVLTHRAFARARESRFTQKCNEHALWPERQNRIPQLSARTFPNYRRNGSDTSVS